MCTPREQTTRWIQFPSATLPGGWGRASRSLETPRITQRATCWLGYAACLMPDVSGQSFVVVRLGSLGDLVHTLPGVAVLRSSFPEARIDWVGERKWSPL